MVCSFVFDGVCLMYLMVCTCGVCIQGCTKGPHNNTRPKEVQKEPETPLEKGEVISVGTPSIPPQALKVMERPS